MSRRESASEVGAAVSVVSAVSGVSGRVTSCGWAGVCSVQA